MLRERSTPVANWYLDLSDLEKYWGKERTYHHTAPITMNYALREALRMVIEEGLEARFARHRLNAALLWQGSGSARPAPAGALRAPPAHAQHARRSRPVWMTSRCAAACWRITISRSPAASVR